MLSLLRRKGVCFYLSISNAANLSNLYCPYFKAKYHGPGSLYYGTIPKFKPRYTVLRSGSIDSNLQFCGSSWVAEEGEKGKGLNMQWWTQPNGHPPTPPRQISGRNGPWRSVLMCWLCIRVGGWQRAAEEPALLQWCAWHHTSVTSSLCFLLYQQ